MAARVIIADLCRPSNYFRGSEAVHIDDDRNYWSATRSRFKKNLNPNREPLKTRTIIIVSHSHSVNARFTKWISVSWTSIITCVKWLQILSISENGNLYFTLGVILDSERNEESCGFTIDVFTSILFYFFSGNTPDTRLYRLRLANFVLSVL